MKIEKITVLKYEKGKKINNDDGQVTKEENHGDKVRERVQRDPEGVPFGEIDPGGNDPEKNETDEKKIEQKENNPGVNEKNETGSGKE